MPRRVVRREYVTDEPEVVERRVTRTGAAPYWYGNPVGIIAAVLIVLLLLFLIFGVFV